MNKNKDEDQIFNEFFAPAKNLEVEPPPFIRAKVLSRLESQKNPIWQKLFFQRFAYVALAVLLVSFSMQAFFSQNDIAPSISYTVGKNYLMKVSIQELNFEKISYVEIVPSENISFVSNKFPDISKKISLKLLGKTLKTMQHIPIAFTSKSAGTEYVRLRFFDKDLEVIYEKSIQLEVTSG